MQRIVLTERITQVMPPEPDATLARTPIKKRFTRKTSYFVHRRWLDIIGYGNGKKMEIVHHLRFRSDRAGSVNLIFSRFKIAINYRCAILTRL